MKLTSRNARADKDGLHNDRNFDIATALHIDQQKMSGNRYTSYLGDDYNTTLKDLEVNYYERTFDEYLTQYNSIQLERRMKNRVMTAEDYYKKKYSRPEDKIIQVGNIDSHIDADELWESCKEYMALFNEKYGDHCLILDMALHVDEATPHVHVRRVWLAEEEGVTFVNQTKALEQMGIKAPKEDEKICRTNNPKMTFTKMEEDMLREIFKQHGIEIEDKSSRGTVPHLSVNEYKRRVKNVQNEYEADIQRLKEEKANQIKENTIVQQEKDNILNEVDRNIEALMQNFIFEQYYAQIKEAKERDRMEALRMMNDIIKNDIPAYLDYISGSSSMEELVSDINTNKELIKMQSFINSKGLSEEYEAYKTGSKEVER